MLTRRILFLFLLAFSFVSTELPASLTDSLTPAQVSELKKKQTVVVSKDIPDAVWPELTLYRLVSATPGEVFSLFTDYANAPSYTPGMISAVVVAQPTPNTKDVRYTVTVPVLSQISYTVRNEYSQKDGVYEVRWKLLESPMASASTGSLTVEPFDKDKGLTVLRYRNHVTPSIPMAGMLKGQALKEAKTTVEAIDAEAVKRSKK